jgi:recombination protein RecT
MSENNAVVTQEKKELSAGERFTAKVMQEFGGSTGSDLALTNFQKRLVSNYFVSIDAALQAAEEKRKKKTKNQDPVPVSWENVNMNLLSRSVVAVARIGLDPAQKNHINMMPFKNNALGKYDIVFIDGYRGMELKAKKYGLEVPNNIIVELVYETDTFKPIKKDAKNKYENYEFEMTNPFNRGKVVGGFYYHCFENQPEKNKLVVMSLKEIEKRKPKHAAAEFWGGEIDVWENGQKVKQQTEGWYEKMCLKTVMRAAYADVTIDSQKIDSDYLELQRLEESYAEMKVEAEIDENANSIPVDIGFGNAQDAEFEMVAETPDF